MKEKHPQWTSGWYDAWRSLLEKSIMIRTRIVIGPDYMGCTTRLAMSSKSGDESCVETVILTCKLGQAMSRDPLYFAPTSHSDFLANEGSWYRGNYSQAVSDASMAPVAHLAVFEQKGSRRTRGLSSGFHPILLPFYGMLHEQIHHMDRKYGESATLSMFYLRFDAFLYQQQRTVIQQSLGELIS
jgi:hypothetical protein